MTGPPKLIIFDCDGVLVDSEPLSSAVVAENLGQYGLNITAEQSMATFTGMTMSRTMQTATAMGARLPDNWIEEVYAQTYAALAESVEAMPGIAELLDLLLRRQIPFCVASNGSPEKMRISLGRTGLLPLFDGAMFSAHSLAVGKPDPTLFLHAARNMGVDPQACCVIEDSAAGAEAAQRAGMRCLGFARDTPARILKDFNAEVFHDITQIAGLLDI
jgi:HAD superfamily hydrolase (TIGR01509 family)